ncbi:MAG: hypothetical protein Q9183_004806, partial [Haloplaca sp. 2 TL-2023]
VHYEMPKSIHVHKSMLLRGVKPAPPALNSKDIEETKGRAAHSGRSFGGVPMRGGHGGGRGRGGGQINYANNRENPFAAHINPGFAPPLPPHLQGGRGPPPIPPLGWAPPPHAQGGGQYNGHVPGPSQGYNGYGPPPPPNGYPGGPPPPSNGYYAGNQNYRDPPPQDRRYSGYNGYR